MSNLTLFTFESMEVRLTDRDGAPWWVLADVCRVLDIANSRDAAGRLDDDEKADVGISDTSSNGVTQRRSMTVISESGLYALILRSHGATTPGTTPHRFRKWVTSEVLPTIRRTGAYSMQPNQPDLTAMRAALSVVLEARRAGGLKAAHAVWGAFPVLPPLEPVKAKPAAPEQLRLFETDIPEWRRQGKYRPHQKFTQTEADAIRAEYKAGGCTTRSLAEKYGTSSPNISRIIRGASYRTDTRLH